MANRTTSMVAVDEISELASDQEQFVTMRVGVHVMGVPMSHVRSILTSPKITPVPLSSPIIEGLINVRGKIAAVINMCKRLGVEPENPTKMTHVVIEIEGELYSLMVDSVGDVLSLPTDQFEKGSMNLVQKCRDVALGVYPLDKELLVILDEKAAIAVD